MSTAFSPAQLRASLWAREGSRVHAVIAQDVADHHRHPRECGERRRGVGEADLYSAVEGEPRVHDIDRAGVERRDLAAVRVLSRKPEAFEIRRDRPRDFRACRPRHEMLSEPRQAGARADPADAVVDVDVAARQKIGAGQHCDREVGLTRAEAFALAGCRQIERREDRQDRYAPGIRPQAKLCANLHVADAMLGA